MSEAVLDRFCRHEADRDEFMCPTCRKLMDRGSLPLYGFRRDDAGTIRWQHDLKILPEFFEAVAMGLKPFEIRRNDREFQVGDVLRLKEWTEAGGFTGRFVQRRVTYVTDFAQQARFVVLGLAPWFSIGVRQAPGTGRGARA